MLCFVLVISFYLCRFCVSDLLLLVQDSVSLSAQFKSLVVVVVVVVGVGIGSMVPGCWSSGGRSTGVTPNKN